MASGQQSQSESWYASLLGLAEHFRTSNPPNIRLCIHCLQSIFTFKPPPRLEARTHLQLGSVMFAHTKNTDQAMSHLEKAVSFNFDSSVRTETLSSSFSCSSGDRDRLLSKVIDII